MNKAKALERQFFIHKARIRFIFYSSATHAPFSVHLLISAVDLKDANSEGLLHLKFNNKPLVVSDVNMEQLVDTG